MTGTDSTLGLTIGGTARSAAYASSTADSITYSYTVQAGDNDADGIAVGSISLGTSTIRDAAGNDANLSLSGHVPSLAGILVDTTTPSVSGNISAPSDATYVAGQALSFTVTFDDNVTVTGTDSTLGLTIGSTAREATYESKTANSITYSYTVQAGDADTDGIAVGALSLGTTTIKDGAGNNADIDLTGHVPSTAGVMVDAVAPTFATATVAGSKLVMTYADASTLDAGNAPAAGAFAVEVAGNPVSVTGVAVDATAKTVTLTLATAVQAGQAVTVAYTDPSVGDDPYALQDSFGNDAASLTATLVTNTTPQTVPSPGPATPAPTTNNVDGVPVQSVTGTASDGTPIRTVTIPVVQAGRQEQTGDSALADIPLVMAGEGQPLLHVQVPTGVGLTASGPTTLGTAGNALADLIREINARTAARPSDQSDLTGGGSDFLGSLSPDTPMLVQTIVPSGTGAGGPPLVISGPPGGSSPVQTALVIDTSSLPGAPIALHNVDFAAIIGSATITGGSGSQHVWGDGAPQNIFLGADDDVLHGGGGADTVASAGGDDQLFGDDGDDVVSGGEGADFVHGNAGNDTVSGDAGDDRVYGGKGDDQAYGGEGDDLLFGDLGQDILQGNLGQDTIEGGQGDDIVYGGQGDDALFGGAAADLLFGDKGDDVLQGNAGADTLQGGVGDDRLHGGQGDDVLFGGDGDDRLSGDYGDDILTGGAGADLFVFFAGGGADRVLDFNLAEGDRVGLLGGAAYSVAQVGADTVITLANGGQIALSGVQLSSLGDGWIVMV